MGSRGSGKTRFFEYIKNKKFSNDCYTQTKQRSRVSDTKAKLKIDDIVVDFDLVNSFDIPGGEIGYNDWKNVAKDADYLLYLINYENFLVGDQWESYQETIIKDIQCIDDIVRKNPLNI